MTACTQWESILRPHLEPYADALDCSWRAERDYLQSVCNEFHARVSWRLADHEEPELPLPDYDPKKVVEEELDDAEEAQKSARIALLDKRIRRWLKYRVRRLCKQLHSRLNAHVNPWAILVGKLAGLTAPPKARQAYQQFMHEEYAERIAPVVAERWAAATGPGSNVQTKKNPDAAFRAAVACELFGKLPENERVAYGTRAKEEAAEKRAEYKAAMEKEPLRAPEDRQSVAYGRNRAADPLHFPAWSGSRFDQNVLALMREYLETAFTATDVEECRLPDTLAGAKYTIAPKSDSDNSASETSDSEDISDDSNADSDDTAPTTKKKKKKSPRKGKKSKAPAGESDADSDDSAPAPAKKAKTKQPAKVARAAQPAKNVAKPTKKVAAAAKGKGRADQPESSSAAKKKSRRTRSDSETEPRDQTRPKKRPRRGQGVDPPASATAPSASTQPAMDVDPSVTTPSASAQAGTSSIVSPTPPATQMVSASPAPDSPVDDDAVLLPVEFPANAPEWLINAIAWLMKVELGPHYRALLVSLINLEARYDFVSGSAALPKAKRPTPVNLWIQGARGAQLKFPPTISNREAYADKWNTWWDSLQPGWRVRGEDGYWTLGGKWGPDDDWGLLEAPGPNGCLGLVAALYMWGVYNKNDPPELVEGWTRATQDVTWMLEGLAASFPMQKKGRSKV
ncbi:hypothetical protein B0H16DRAFT_1451897 [Mycena metata]|uniref:Uncharacterized protein n=1 Tax=Mycena metata TaxID=1033252 RepID=A0AAD7JRG9_9AGAR|nr:hypothetical protein B0H16DRAFT_1451897 [Mycena metata]